MDLDQRHWMRHGVGMRMLLPSGYCFELNSFVEMTPVRKSSGWISAVDAWCRADRRGGGLTGSEGCLLGMGVMELKTELILHGPRCLFLEDYALQKLALSRTESSWPGDQWSARGDEGCRWCYGLAKAPKLWAAAHRMDQRTKVPKLDAQANKARCSRE